MFKQIVSKLSLSPSAVSELAFYARRLKQERITRTFSAVGALLIVGLQLATILIPPNPTNAASPSDIIYGGFVSKDDLLNRYDASAELQALYAYFGISRTDIVGTTAGEIVSRDHTLNSVGRVQHAAEDQQIIINGNIYWARYLYQFDTGNNVYTGSYYKVLQGTRASDGGYFAVIFHCGNIVFQTIPPQPTPTPTPTPVPTPTPKPTPTPIPPAYEKSKSAFNQTQNVDATTVPAHAGDIIQYTLTTKNIGGSAGNYTVVEHLEDVLEYADITDANGGSLANGILTWAPAIIKPGESLTKTVKVQIKNPIPATPVGLSDKFSYDLRMDNVYGNDVRVIIDQPLAKLVEGASTSMPQTGPGTSTLIILVVAALALYFYFRNRQLSREVKLLRHDYHGGTA